MTYGICDEAVQLSESKLMAFARGFPNSRQLFLTGNARQLYAHKLN